MLVTSHSPELLDRDDLDDDIILAVGSDQGVTTVGRRRCQSRRFAVTLVHGRRAAPDEPAVVRSGRCCNQPQRSAATLRRAVSDPVEDPATIVPIVEGHGEVQAVPVLLRRIAAAIAPDRHVDVVSPIRVQRSKVIKPTSSTATSILPPGSSPDAATASWSSWTPTTTAPSSLRPTGDDLSVLDHPESVRDAKGWLQDRRTDGRAYGPTVDQPALAALFDLDAARANAPSFDKLWRDMAQLIASACRSMALNRERLTPQVTGPSCVPRRPTVGRHGGC